MLNSSRAVATIAVSDMERATQFYEGVLGLTLDHRREGAYSFKSGDAQLIVYRSQFAGTNKATSATWMVGREVGTVVHALKEKGVVFEHYELPNTHLDGDVHVSGDMQVAWFKDPDGNILCIVSG